MNILAERAVIGSILMDADSIAKVMDDLHPEMFENQILQRAYFEASKSYGIGERINLINLSQKMQAYGFSDEEIYCELRACVDSVVVSTEIVSYARVLINDYKVMQVSAIMNNMRPVSDDIDNQIGELINELEALRNSGTKGKIRAFAEIIEEQEAIHFVDNPEMGVHIGFDILDDFLVLLEPGDVFVIGARPAVGKSAFVTQIIGNLSENGKRGALYNLEMSDKQIYERMLSAHSGIELKRVRMAKAYLNDEKEKVDRANKKLKGYNLYIHSGPVKPSEIRAECRNLELDYIVIDYLQLMRSDVWYPNRVNEVGGISKAVKSVAMDLGVPIILLSQLNRASENRATKEPELSDLRESGDIEQDASFVMFLWNTNDEDDSCKGAKVAKNRQGELGKVELSFTGSQMKFRELGIMGGFTTTSEEETPFD